MINNIRIASNQLYNNNVQFQSTNSVNDIDFNNLLSKTNSDSQNNENKINPYSLGAPAGFFADISMLDESDAKEIGIIQFDANPHLMQ